MGREDIASVAPRPEVVHELARYGDEIMKGLVWSGNCRSSLFLSFSNLYVRGGSETNLGGKGRSWYKQNRPNGRVTATFAGSAMLFHDMVERIRPEDFEIRYRCRGNRWRFLGNGFTRREREGIGGEGDLAWYVER